MSNILRRSAIVLFFLQSQSVFAHVKWFSPYDVTESPRAIFSVITPEFWFVFIASTIAVFFIALIDRSAIGVKFHDYIDTYRTSIKRHLPEDFSARAIRFTLLAFFICIWTLGGVILTPELKYENSLLIGALHLLIIFCLFTPRTSRYAGVGILLLWLYAAYHYGFFHLSDYAIFIGLGVFLIFASYRDKNKTTTGFLLLYIAISITLQWASIEKWVYPEWSFPILESRPYMTMGLDKEQFMILAGFIEFVFAFLIISVSGLGFVMTTIALALIFILAIVDFGKLDAIGHMAIIGSLLVMALHGPTKINLRFANMHSNNVYNAALVSLSYCASITAFFLLYYGIRFVWLSSTSVSH